MGRLKCQSLIPAIRYLPPSWHNCFNRFIEELCGTRCKVWVLVYTSLPEIARAHGGTLDVNSSTDETRFTFRMRQTKTS